MGAFIKFNKGMMKMPVQWQLWLMLLVTVNLLVPLFFLARGLTYVAWVHTRHETETAKELTPMLLTAACELAEEYLSNQ